jgi:hypothetical protein
MIPSVNLCLMFGTAGVACFNLRARVIFSREDKRIQKYALFKVRDDLIHLVAEEKLREDGFVFAHFYRTIDFFIRHADQLSLKSVVGALRQAQERGLDPAESQELKRIQQELNLECPEVREVVSEFYGTMMQILMENSFVLRFVVNHAGMWLVINDARRLIGSMFSTERQAYAFYKAYRNAARLLAHAA